MPPAEIARELQSQISQSIRIEADANGRHYIAMPFAFADGDQPVVALAPYRDGWLLSDQGQTLLRLGFQLNDAEYDDPENRRRLDSALAMAGISRHDGELTKPLPPGRYADAVFDFIHALLKIDELGDFPATRPRRNPGRGAHSQFTKEVAKLVSEVVRHDRFQVDWHDAQWDHKKEYTVDCRINGMPTPLFLYALATDNKARDATITIYRFQSQSVPGQHIAIYRDASEIPGTVRSRLSAVCETTFGNLKQDSQGIIDFLKRETVPSS